MAILNMRTGYVLEYVAPKGRSTRREFVADLVPVEIMEVDSLDVAVNVTNREGVSTPTHWVKDGLLYERFSRMAGGQSISITTETFDDVMAGRQDLPRSSHTWSLRKDLLWQGLGRTDTFEVPLRDGMAVQKIVSDGQADGAAFAQTMGDAFLIHNGDVFIRAQAPAVMVVEVEGSKDPIAKWSHAFNSGSGASQHTKRRSFRPDDHDGINDWITRHLSSDQAPYEEDRKGYRTQWTPEGLAAEDMLSWWTIWSIGSIFRSDTVGRDWSLLSGDGRVLRALADIKDIDDRIGHFLPEPDEAAELATEIAVAIECLQDALGTKSDRWGNLQKFLEYILEERRHSLMLEELPTLTAIRP